MTVIHDFGGISFAWNQAKAVSNHRKHGVTFEEAVTAFADPFARVFDDPGHSSGSEKRFLLFGHSLAGKALIVVHVERGAMLRIISARCATPREKRAIEDA